MAEVSVQAICNSFLLECWQAIHDFDNDAIKLALFNASATDLGKNTTAYSSTNEVSGTGYSAGGISLSVANGFPKAGLRGNKVLLDFDDVSVAPLSLSSAARYGLIYNSSKSNRAIAVIDFLPAMTVNVSLAITWPTGDDDHALLRVNAPAGG